MSDTRLILLDPLTAVAVGRIDKAGRLLYANLGLRRLLGTDAENLGRFDLHGVFQTPNLDSLLRDAIRQKDPVIYEGLLTLGEIDGNARTLKARIQRDEDTLLLVAEFDVEELEQLFDQARQLSVEATHAQRELISRNRELNASQAEIRRLSLTDELTGVANRRQLNQALDLELSRLQRYGETLSAVICDLDHFKRINDEFGHGAGDRVLQRFAHLLQRELRDTDLVARFGGEEFVLLMPRTSLVAAAEVIERVRASIEARLGLELGVRLTASFGLSCADQRDTAESLLGRADRALYQAKALGRNRVEQRLPPPYLSGASKGLAPLSPDPLAKRRLPLVQMPVAGHKQH